MSDATLRPEAETGTEVRCLLVPTAGEPLLLPSTAVAEVAPYAPPVRGEGYPEWLLGGLAWRGRTIPLVSLEALAGGKVPEAGDAARIAVCNTVTGDAELPFYALLVQGIPRLARVTAEALSPGDDSPQFAIARSTLDGEPVLIPDLEAVERAVRDTGVAEGFKRQTLSLDRGDPA